MPFLEEQLPGCADYGSAFGAGYAVDIVVDAYDSTYTHMRHPYPVKRFEMGFGNKDYEYMLEQLLDLFHRCGGMFGGFRMPDRTELSTNNYRDTPTFADQPAVEIDAVAGTYQITRWYGSPTDPLATRRRIRKPRTGTVLAGIRAANGVTAQITAFAVDTTTGIITLSANKTDTVVGITQAASAVVDVGANTFLVGESVVFSGVVGMNQINGRRGTITAKPDSTHITVDINTTAMSAYVSGGTVNTRPQTGEAVMAGCLFDIPVRFETDLSGITFANLNVLSTVVNLAEILNPD